MDLQYKIVVLGKGAVGKSALTIRFITHSFVEQYEATIEDSYDRRAEIDGNVCNMSILDTAGQDEYGQMQDQWIRDGEGFLLVYGIDNRSSFRAMQSFREKIMRIKENSRYSIVLAGNKCDLESTRQVTREEGEALAKLWQCPFIETSAKAKINNEECFYQVVREIRKKNEATQAPKPVGKKKRYFCLLL